jgi:hypothetical protein
MNDGCTQLVIRSYKWARTSNGATSTDWYSNYRVSRRHHRTRDGSGRTASPMTSSGPAATSHSGCGCTGWTGKCSAVRCARWPHHSTMLSAACTRWPKAGRRSSRRPAAASCARSRRCGACDPRRRGPEDRPRCRSGDAAYLRVLLPARGCPGPAGPTGCPAGWPAFSSSTRRSPPAGSPRSSSRSVSASDHRQPVAS